MTEKQGLIERLRRKVQLRPAFGSGSIGNDGTVTSHVIDDGMRHVNPDGPEAADALEGLANYAAHYETCRKVSWTNDGPCTCGLETLLKELDQ